MELFTFCELSVLIKESIKKTFASNICMP
uniref:Uncharacterized protein n=1 Tax=Anguilla anguilla TaxID=7936 RepID=A0A0E9RSY4_ANGAN